MDTNDRLVNREYNETLKALIAEGINPGRALLPENFDAQVLELELNEIEPSENPIENLKTAKEFITRYLVNAKPSEVDEFILLMVEVFKLKPKTNYIRALKQHYKEEKNLYDKAKEEEEKPKERALPPLEERLKAYPENVIDEANDILDNRDPFEYIMKTWKRLHIGDYDLGRGLACSIVNTRLINAGIGGHYKPSGDPESGKTDAMLAMTDILPVWAYRITTFSPKALYYMENLYPGTIIFTDDIELKGNKGEEVISTIKKVTAKFSKPTTIDVVLDGKPATKSIPERITFWLSSVDPIDDVQLGTRFFFNSTETGEEHDKKVNYKQSKRLMGERALDDDFEVQVCRCMFEYILSETHSVVSTYGFTAKWSEVSRKRNYEKFMDILLSVTIFQYRQRDTVHGHLIGTKEDWDRAVSIYKAVAHNNSILLTDEEIKILNAIRLMMPDYEDGVPRKDLYKYLKEHISYNKSESTLIRTLTGDPRTGGKGFKEKVPGFSFETQWKKEAQGKQTVFTYEGCLFEGILEGMDPVETIRGTDFVIPDTEAAKALETLFRENPESAYALIDAPAGLEEWRAKIHRNP